MKKKQFTPLANKQKKEFVLKCAVLFKETSRSKYARSSRVWKIDDKITGQSVWRGLIRFFGRHKA